MVTYELDVNTEGAEDAVTVILDKVKAVTADGKFGRFTVDPNSVIATSKIRVELNKP